MGKNTNRIERLAEVTNEEQSFFHQDFDEGTWWINVDTKTGIAYTYYVGPVNGQWRWYLTEEELPYYSGV